MNDAVGGTMVEKVSVPGHSVVAKPLRHFLLASLTIAAILLGLLAMHALSPGTSTQTGQAAQSQMSSTMSIATQTASGMQPKPVSDSNAPPAIASALVAASAVISAQGSADMAIMNCLLVGMVCALSLLVALIGAVLIAHPFPSATFTLKIMRILRIITSKFVLPTTPSLTALSVIRI